MNAASDTARPFGAATAGTGGSDPSPVVPVDNAGFDTVVLRLLSLSDVRFDQVNEFDERTGKGKLRGLRVRRNEWRNSLRIEGNLRSYLYDVPHNLYAATPDDCRFAIEKLSDVFGVDLSFALVSRADVAATVAVKYPCGLYTDAADTLPRTQRGVNGTTTYFGNKSRTIRLYDKAAQLREVKRLTLPELSGLNVLRAEAEHRNRRSVYQYFGNLRAVHLADERMFGAMMRKHAALLNRIIFRESVRPLERMTARQIEAYLYARHIAEHGLSAELARAESLRTSATNDKAFRRAMKNIERNYLKYACKDSELMRDFRERINAVCGL